MITPILMLGAGRMGGAILEGWRRAGVFAGDKVMIVDPQPSDSARAAERAGAKLNPPTELLASARTVLFCVKPQIWRDAAAHYAPLLAPDALIVSIAAGVMSDDLARAFGGRQAARVMPTTAAAIGRGTASLFAAEPAARAAARALFEPLGAVADLGDEALMHAATAVSGSGPAYLYAFTEALEAAGVDAGLTPAESARLARSTIIGAAMLMAEGESDPADLRRQVTSPGGTTEAALNVLMGDAGLQALLRDAVRQAVLRSRALGASPAA